MDLRVSMASRGIDSLNNNVDIALRKFLLHKKRENYSNLSYTVKVAISLRYHFGGRKLVRRLKHLERLNHTPIIQWVCGNTKGRN